MLTRRKVFILLGLVAIGFLVAAEILAFHPKSNASYASVAPIGPGSAPIPGAIKEPTIAAAEKDVGYHIIRPSTCVASDATIQTIWVDAASGQAAIDYQPVAPDQCTGYSDGAVEIVESLVSGPPPKAVLDQEVAALGNGVSEQVVDGVPAIVIDGNFQGDCASPAPQEQGCASAQNNPAAVELVLSNTDMQVYGAPDWSESQVIGVAASLK